MAKAKKTKNVTKERHESEKVLRITTPSWFGSHTSMVVWDGKNGPCSICTQEEWPVAESMNPTVDEVVCRDDRGLYKTLKKRLDDGLADPNRYNRR